MNNIYGYQCYRDVIRAVVKGQGTSYRAIASATQIHTSYFSRVMAEGAEFSADQLFKICKALQLQEAETTYVLLLGDMSRSSHHDHKVFLKQKLEAIQEKHLRLADQLQGDITSLEAEQIEMYFHDVRLAKIHMLLTIPRFRMHPQQISKRLGLSESELTRLLERLQKLGLVRLQKNAVTHVEQNVHLDEHHPLSLINHKNWRIDCLHHLNTGEREPHDYHFSATFSCDADTKGRIKEILKDAIIQAQRQVSECARVENAYVLTLDLY
ncbi:MAG TPA: DUF4423 domain-containing protein [Oligoflexus sp.]|uniref:DUF4423 domain-containing protein n=1 Tax=Oligoflexus sp. TaxID=1971216 RepID=UPI002D2E4AD7|nr:DUF4423 domain-containing protein [Oligoflexus sp.]HYX32809.1 DUF4423 domain-containing protein [Oligoflexus sp.]